MYTIFYVVFVTVFLVNVYCDHQMQSTLTSEVITEITKTTQQTETIETTEPTTPPNLTSIILTSKLESIFREGVLGLYAARIAFTLRDNLINLFGYIMYQKQRHIGMNLHYCLNELKQGLKANAIDVFELIPSIPAIAMQELNQQMLTLLAALEKIAPKSFCMIKCSIREWKRKVEILEMNLVDYVWHFGYNPILHGIIESEDEEELKRIRNISAKISRSIKPANKKQREIIKVFGPSFLKIVLEIKTKRFCLSEELIGYLMAFYPWPLNSQNIEVALSHLKYYFTDDDVDLLRCEIKITELEEMIDKPIDMLIKLLSDIENSWCDSNIRVAATIVGNALKLKSTTVDYTNTFRRNLFVEPNSVFDLLNIITLEKYPLEIVLATNRVYKYLQKLIFYINRQKFVPYNYDTLEEAQYALLNFIMNTTPHAPLPIKQSIKAIRAYLAFYVKPVTISYNLLLTVIDGFLAPDLRDDIIEEMIEVKKMALDERQAITQILQTRHKEKCMELMSCYLKITSILKNDDRFGPEKSEYMILPESLFRRFVQSQVTQKMESVEIVQLDIMSLLDILNYHDYPREIVLAADKLREYIRAGAHMLPKFHAGMYCTKQEVLLAYLRQITKLGSLSTDVNNNLKSMISPLIFMTTYKTSIDLEVFSRVLDTWRMSETGDFFAEQVKLIDEFLVENDKEVETALSTMDAALCQNIFDCYNNIANHLNEQGMSYTFLNFRLSSPDLSFLNLGTLKPMTTQLLLKIAKSVQTLEDQNNELEAAMSYAQDFSDELDKHLMHVDCNQLDVINCFQKILDRLRFATTNLKVNILQFLLTPTTCDNVNCRWISYDEKGSTILNPVLDYMAYLLEKYKDSLKSMHLQMDLSEIVKYLYRDNINYVLDNFEIVSIPQSVERISVFIKMLSESNLIEEDVQESIKNVRQYMYTNKLPNQLTVGNLLALHEIFSEMTNHENVLCHLHQSASRINRKREIISKVLSQIEVDCFSLETCLDSFQVLTEHGHSEQPGTPLIMELVKPDICTPQICPWLRAPLKAEYVDVKRIIIREMELIGLNRKSPLIVQALMGFMKYVARSPNILENLEKVGKRIINADRKLQVYLDWLVKRPETPKRKAMYYEVIERYLRTGQVPTIINNYCMMFIMRTLRAETYDIMVSRDIDSLLSQLTEMELYTEKWLSKFRVRCDNLDQCIQSIYNNIKKLGIGDDGIPLHIMRILRAIHCSKVDCPHKIEFTKDERDIFVEDGLALLEKLKNEASCPYHIQMDVDNLIKSVTGNFITKIVEEVMYDTSKDRYLHLLKHTISAPDCTKELKHTAENIYNYKLYGNLPSHLLFSDLMIITEDLKQMTTNDDIILQMDEIAEKLLNVRDEVNDLLEKSLVDCKTLESCLVSLTIRMLKRYENPIAQDILNLIEPETCSVYNCPWTKNSPTNRLRRQRNKIIGKIKSILTRKDLSLHIRMNLEELNNFFKDNYPFFEYYSLRRKGRHHTNDTLLVHIRNLGKQMLAEKGLEVIKQNVEDFLAHNVLPEIMDIKTFVAFSRVLMKTVKDPTAIDEMNKTLKKIQAQKQNFGELMKNCKINCFKVKSCVETMLECTRSDLPESIQVRNMLAPSQCSAQTCEFLVSESRQYLLVTLEEVKHDFRVLARNISTPLIISIEVNDLISFLKLKNVENELVKVAGSRNKGRVMCRYLSSKKSTPHIRRRASDLYSYYASRRLSLLTYSDLAGLSKVMMQNAKDVDLRVDFQSILDKQEVHENETEAELKTCKIKCVDLKPCLTDIKNCLEGSNLQIIREFISFLAPPHCSRETCPWMPDGLEQGPAIVYPIETIQPTVIIIFYEDPYDDEIMSHILLDLTNTEVVKKIQKYTGAIKDTRMRVTSLTVGNQILNFYFNKLDMYKKLAVETEQAAIDLSKDSEFVLCIPFPSEDTRPLKFNIMKAGVRESLMAIGAKQGPTSTKPKVILSDYDGTKNDLVIDVMNQHSLMEIMRQTIDDINPDQYWPMTFWPALSNEQVWKSVVITQNEQILRYLSDLPGVDYANKMTPIVVGKDGIISIDFDPYKRKFRREMDNMFLKVPILKSEEHFQYTFYVAHPLEKCCIPIYVDLKKSSVIQGLKAFNSKFPLKGDEPTFLVTPTEDDTSTFPVYINFADKDMVDYLIGLKGEPIKDSNNTEIDEIETPTTMGEIIDEFTVSATPPKLIIETITTIPPFPATVPPDAIVSDSTTNSNAGGSTTEEDYLIISEVTAPNVEEVTSDEPEETITNESILTTVKHPDTSVGYATTEEEYIIIPEETSNKPQTGSVGNILTSEKYSSYPTEHPLTTEEEAIVIPEVTSNRPQASQHPTISIELPSTTEEEYVVISEVTSNRPKGSQYPTISTELPSTTEEDFIIIPEVTSNRPQGPGSGGHITTSELYPNASMEQQSTTEEDFITIPEVTSNRPKSSQYPTLSVELQSTTEEELIVISEVTSKRPEGSGSTGNVSSSEPNTSLGQQVTTEESILISEVTSKPPKIEVSSFATQSTEIKSITTQGYTMTMSTTTESPSSPSSEMEKSTTVETTTETTSDMTSNTSISLTESTSVASTVASEITSSTPVPTSETSTEFASVASTVVSEISSSTPVATFVTSEMTSMASQTASTTSESASTVIGNDTSQTAKTIYISNVTTETSASAIIHTETTTAEGSTTPISVVTENSTQSTITANSESTTGTEDIGTSSTVESSTTNIEFSSSMSTVITTSTGTESTTAEITSETQKATTGEQSTVIPEVTSTYSDGESQTTTEGAVIIPEMTSNIPEIDKPTIKEETVDISEITTNIAPSEVTETSRSTTEEEEVIIPEVSSDIPTTSILTTNAEIEITIPEETTTVPETEESTKKEQTTTISYTTLQNKTTTIADNMTITEETKRPLTEESLQTENETTIEEVTEELITEVPVTDCNNICDLILIPIANKTDIVVLNLDDAAVISTLRDLSGKLYHNGPSMVFNVLDFNEDVIPIGLNPDDPIVIKMLKALVENTAVSFKPRNIEATDRLDIIIVSQKDDFGKVKHIVLEDSDFNKKLVQPYRASTGEQFETIPFSSGSVDVPLPPGLTILTEKLASPRLAAVNYASCRHKFITEFVLPVYKHGKPYYFFFDTTKPNILEELAKLSYNASADGTVVTVLNSENKQVHITLDLTQEDVVLVLNELCIRKELQGDVNGAIAAIVTANKASIINSFLLDLSHNKVLKGLTAMSRNINPSSTTKGVIYYRHRSGKIITIVVDYDAYNFKKLKKLERFTSINLKSVFLPNFDGDIPYLAFMIFDNSKTKRSVVLNLGDKAVLKKLQRFSRSHSYNLPIRVRLDGNKLYKFYINKTDPRTIDGLIELTNRCPVISVPTQTIQRDGSYKVIIPLRGVTKFIIVELDTKNKEVMKTLKDLEIGASLTVPTMMVLNPDGVGEEIRIDANNKEKFDILLGHADNFKLEILPQTMLVIWLPVNGFAVIDCSNDVVVKELEKLSLIIPNKKMHEHIIFQDSNKMIVSIHLALRDKIVIEKLLQLAEMTSENRNPITIMVRPSRKIVIFTILNTAKAVRPVILDITNKSVINQLIEVSNPHKGITINLKDARKNPLVVHLDTSDAKVVWKLLELTKLTSPLPPFVYPPYTEDFPELRIPITDRETNISFMHICNMTDPVMVDRFLKIPGKNTKGTYPGTALPIINLEKDNAIAFLDLTDDLVLRKMRELCPNHFTIVNPGKILLLVLKNNLGKHDYVFLNINNDTILQELKSISEKSYDSPDLHKYQIIDPDGNVCTIKLNLQNDGVQEKLKQLNKLSASSGSGNFVISKEDKEHLVIIISNYDKPIIVPIDQVKEIEHEIDEIKKLVEEGKIAEANEIQQNIPQNFFEVNLLPGSIFIEGRVQIACLNNKDQSVRLTLNLRKRNVRLAIKQAAAISERGKPMVTIKLINKKKITAYNLDNANPKVCNLLRTHCDDYFFCPKENSLLILKVRNGNRGSKMIILDLSNRKVLDELQSIAKTTKIRDVTRVGIHMADGYVIPFKLNTNNKKVAQKLIKLADLTPAPTIPVQAVDPNGQIPFVVFTLKSKKGDKHHFVLDLSSSRARIKLTKARSARPKRPYLITYKQLNGKEHKWLLDLNWKTVMLLRNFTKMPSMPKDAILNVPKKNAVLVKKAIVPTEDYDGNVAYKVLDLTNPKIKVKLNVMYRNMTKSMPAMVVYTKDSNHFTRAWRIDIKHFENYINSNTTRIQKAYLHPNALLIITFLDSMRELRAVVLDVYRKEVDIALKMLTEATPKNSEYSMVILDTFADVEVMIRLDLKNETVQKALLELQETTPTPLIPTVVSSPSKSTHMVVLTITGINNKTTPIILDLNNPQVVDELNKISRPGDKNTFLINVSNQKTKSRNVYINVFRKRSRQKLETIARLCPLFKAPITLQKHEMKTIPINDKDGTMMSMRINTSDSSTISTLMKLSHNTPDDKANLWFNILDGYGNIVTIKLDKNDEITRTKLEKIHRKVITPEGPIVTPPTGSQPLITISVKEKECYSSYTLDPNLNSVISILKKISAGSHRGKRVQQLKVIDKNMKEFTVYIDSHNPDVVRNLYEASQLSDIQTSPSLITPSTGKEPLIHFVAKRSQNHMVSFTVDLNDEKVITALKNVSLSEPTEAYTFMEDIYLNMSDSRTIEILQGITEKSYIKLIPNSQQLPIVQFGSDIRLNLCNVKVVGELINLDDQNAKDVTQIFVRNPSGVMRIVALNLKEEKVLVKMKKITSYTPVPTFTMKIRRWAKEVKVLPITLIHAASMEPILMGTHPALGKITIVLNDKATKELSKVKLSANNKESFIEVKDAGVDIKRIGFDAENKDTHKVVQHLNSISDVSFDMSSGCWFPIVHFRKKNGGLLVLDLANKTVLRILENSSERDNSSRYILQIPSAQGYTQLRINPDDPEIERRLLHDDLADNGNEDEKKLSWATFELKHNGQIYKFTVDINNSEMMKKLEHYSGRRRSIAHPKPVMIPKINKKFYFDISCVRCRKLLEELTVKTTGLRPQIQPLISKTYHKLKFYNNYGKMAQVVLDMSNSDVVDDLRYISDNYRVGLKELKTTIEMSNGTKGKFVFDIGDSKTIDKLRCLERSSLTGVDCRIDRGDRDENARGNILHINLDTRELGAIQIAVNPYNPMVLKKLLDTNKMVKRWRYNETITFNNPIDDKVYMLHLDSMDSQVLYNLFVLAKMSTGNYPLNYSDHHLRDLLKLPAYVTIEVDNGYDVVPVTMNKHEWHPKKARSISIKSTKHGIIGIHRGETNETIRLDLEEEGVWETLSAISIPSVCIKQANNADLHTIFIIKHGDIISMIHINLAEKETVLAFLKIAEKYGSDTKTSCVQIRDSNGQYVPVEINMENMEFHEDLLTLAPYTKNAVIDARLSPYLVICTPIEEHSLRIKLTTKNIKRMVKLNSGTKLLTVTIQARNSRFYHVKVDFYNTRLLKKLSKLHDSSWINPRTPDNVFVAYITEGKGVNGVYLDMDNDNAFQMLKNLHDEHTPGDHLTVIKCWSNMNSVPYFTVNLNNQIAFDKLKAVSMYVSEHTLVKTKMKLRNIRQRRIKRVIHEQCHALHLRRSILRILFFKFGCLLHKMKL